MSSRIVRPVVTAALLGLLAPLAFSQTVRDTVTINFRQSKIEIDSTYMGNAAELGRIRQRIADLEEADSSLTVTRIEVVGGASPEGPLAFNQWLSVERARQIYSLVRTPNSPADSAVAFTYLGRDWNGLRRLVEADPEVPHRRKVLNLIDDIVARCEGGEKEADRNLDRLKRLQWGVPYLYMYRNHFPQLRASTLTLDFERVVPAPAMPEVRMTDAAAVLLPDTLPGMAPEWIECRPFYMDISTNMITDALLVPNLAIEFYVGRGFSVRAEWMYGWWDKNRLHRYWRVYGGGVEGRWWFGREAKGKPLTGHHIGLYAQTLTYDIEFGGKGYLGGKPEGTLWEQPNFGAGLSYGYSLPIKRRLNIDFSLAVGYFGGKYYEYKPTDGCYEWTSTKHLRYFGPTKLEVSLVWLIGCDNRNRPKPRKAVDRAEKGGAL